MRIHLTSVYAAHPAVGPFKAALGADRTQFASFTVDDVNFEYDA